jgi:hypothetical protein
VVGGGGGAGAPLFLGLDKVRHRGTVGHIYNEIHLGRGQFG